MAGTLQEMVVAAGGPLLLTIDDCQALPTWFVDAVGRAVAGHLSTDPVSVVLAWKDLPHVVPFHPVERDLPRHRLAGLTEGQAAQLLSTRFDRLPGPAVLAELVAGTGGNPLALVEVYGRLTADQIEGWQPLPDPLPVGSLVAEAFDVAAHLPTATRQALAVVAAARAPRDTLLAVLDGVGIDPADLAPATDAGVLVERGPRVDFAHPLVRAAAFFCAPASVRRAARQVLSNELARQHAIESSAFHAAADADGPDDVVSRRLAQAAQAALERGDPEAAARYEERASRFATGDDAVVLHMATAAGLWITAGRRDRARRCVDVVGHHRVSDPVAGELAYQRARLVPETAGADVADQIAAAADGCVAGAPNRAVAMLVDAAAWKLLAGELLAAETVVQRAGALAASVSSQAEVLVGAMRAATLLAQGQDVEALAERSRISLLIGQTERFPSSPEVALVVGTSLIRQGMWRQAERWAHWVERSRGRERRSCPGRRAVPAAGLDPPRRRPAGRRRAGRRRRCRPGRAARQRRRCRLGLVRRHAAPRAHRRPPSAAFGIAPSSLPSPTRWPGRPGCGPCRRSPCSSSSRVGSARRWRGSAPSRRISPISVGIPAALRPARRSTSSRPRSPRQRPPSSCWLEPPSGRSDGPGRRTRPTACPMPMAIRRPIS